MSLNKTDTWVIASSVIIIIIITLAFLFPRIVDNIITGLASSATFDVSVSVIHAVFEINNRTQLDLVLVNGTNINITMPVTYYDNITMNLSLEIPTGFECGFGWYVNESGSIKSVTANTTYLSWEADKSVKDTDLYFEAPPPSIISEVIYTGDSYYEKNIVIESCCPLSNVSVNISVSMNYQDYILYQIENNTLVNKTGEYHLQVANGWAYFYGFNLSNKSFRIQAAPNATIVERIITVGGGGGGGGGGGAAVPLLNYTPGQKFLVEPNYISIITSVQDLIASPIIIYNLKGEDETFNISSTGGFIIIPTSTVTIWHKDYMRVPVYINTSGLSPGKYTGYIYVRSDKEEENVTVGLELLESQREVGGQEKPPTEQQPGAITSESKEEGGRARISVLRIVLISIIGLLLMGAVVFLHLRSRTRIIRY